MLKSSKVSIPRSYSAIALAFALLASACIWLFCYIVDPYDLYPDVPGLSSEKSVDLFWYLRLHKPYAVERIQPELLIAGSSRAAAMPPAALKAIDGSAYNVSLPGATLREVRQMVEHAYASKPQKLLLVSLDHPMFRKGNSEQMVFDEPHRYRIIDASPLEIMHHWYQHIVDLWRSLFSVDAMIDSMRILLGIGHSETEYHKDGTWDINSLSARPPMMLYASLSNQIYSGEMTGKTAQFKFDELTDLLDFTDAKGIRVILLISPMQGLIMQTVYLAGTWEDYLKWQRDLVALVNARNTDTQIYGIEDNPELVLEAINTPNARFRDGIHYTQQAGSEITRCLVGPCDSDLQPTRLDSTSIDSYLEQVDALRRHYVQENPTDVARLPIWLQLK